MSNEDRIRNWRAQREAGTFATDPQATAMTAAFRQASELAGEAKAHIRSILTIVIETLAAFPDAGLGQRRTVYARVAQGIEAGIARQALPDAVAEFWTHRLQAVTRAVEADVRRDVDIFAPDYAPDGLDETDARLRARSRALLVRSRSGQRRAERRSATQADVAHV
ncbi:MAG: hypothetical protein ACRYG4_00325, partial [Janthinobacterium lividum]